jgi:hypothetical protein
MSLPTSPDPGSPEQAPRRPLIPDWLSRLPHLLWICTLPQVLLLFINLRAYGLITGELQEWQRTLIFRLFWVELALLVGVTALALIPLRRPKALGWWTAAPIFLTAAGFLWAVTMNGEHLIPASVGTWMLPGEMLIYYQFILIMPVVFYTGVWMSCRPTRARASEEFKVIALAIVGTPILLWAFAVAAHDLGFEQHVREWVLFAFIIAGSIVVLAALTRGSVMALGAIRRGPPIGRGIFLFLIGVAWPLGGLLLNYHIPFPNDFQAWPVYALAALNGCVLMLPARLGHRRAVWLARCALFPFTIYFFLVFLPFLPLSTFAMILYGAGLLMLVPTALFLVHGQLLLEGFQLESAQRGRMRALLAAAAALTILPAFFIASAVFDRVVLRGALDYVYSPDLRHQDHFRGSRAAVRRSLEHLRDFKAGVQLPFLSDFYTWAVFDNLVLPDEKMNVVHRAFFGTDVPEVKEAGISILSGRPDRRGIMREFTNTASIAPPTSVKLDGLTATTVREGSCERTSFRLELQGTGSGQNEFSAAIHIPEGVFVSGFWLTIGPERVPGRLFEKKAAMWVYQQISRVQRCDPGILVYRDPHTIDLRVFPITGPERRVVELEVLYPAGTHPAVKIGDRDWQGEGSGPASALTLTNEGTSALVLNPETVAQIPRAQRTPYLHLIIDRSAGAALPDDQIDAAIRAAAATFPQVKEYMATWANYEFSDVLPEPQVFEDVSKYAHYKRLERRGGFLAERAIERALLAYRERLEHAAPGSPWLERYPVFVLLGSKAGCFKPGKDLAAFASFAPDSELIYATPEASKWEAFDFTGARRIVSHRPVDFPVPSQPTKEESLHWKDATRPTALLRVGDAIAPCALAAAQPAVIHFASTSAERSLTVLDGAAFRPLAVATTVPPDAPYARGTLAEQRFLGLTYNPSLGNRGLEAIVNLSRETGILLGATSYIVVENSAQWEMLKRKEKQKLKNHNALEFEEIPEPAAALLLLAGGALLVARRRPSRPVHRVLMSRS